jgi:KaiC/GvpD/RAD55 family RecA-like ATPase
MPEAAPLVLGLPEVDRELASALPKGWLCLLEGRAGSGAALFAKQFAAAAIGRGPVLYYTTYEPSDDIARAYADHGWSTDGLTVINLAEEYYERVLRHDLEVSRMRERGLTFADLSGAPSTPARRRAFNLPNRVLSDLSAVDRPFRIVIDSLDFFLEVLDVAEVMTVARQVRHRVQQFGGQALLVLQTDIHERRVQGLLEDLADLVIELHAIPGPEEVAHGLAIRKVRNHPDKNQMTALRATDKGLVVAPSRDGAANAPAR